MERLFPSQEPNEVIHIVVREDMILLAIRLVVWLIIASLVPLFYRYAPEVVPALFEGQLGIVTALFTNVYLMFLLVGLFIIFVLYYLNIHVVTNIRIVDIDQTGLFNHTVSELRLEKIEDVTSETKGVLGTLFNFGTVYVQTAGAKERFEFENIPDPAMVSKMILDLYSKEKNGEGISK